nr:unnamed protein product [Digitaria exilis]
MHASVSIHCAEVASHVRTRSSAGPAGDRPRSAAPRGRRRTHSGAAACPSGRPYGGDTAVADQINSKLADVLYLRLGGVFVFGIYTVVEYLYRSRIKEKE